ncbi:hypothetical protein ORV05_22515 [Amycolatopsis cynarae]|uniref:Tetratricopeptide repeat protein n=1 Tax=Amycolatopsis cynarae TaxID=2995223 RepID=A0ABY7AUX3_9PSEU|nr:hypothetical protein [Amycolatopsis sp. HUAS 11-8]WAL63765.1 hypothetical protein ORV05_22515 [Amycolatopsis sp. HUAS 11-8]
MSQRQHGRPARTVLEQKIWDRGETLAEFVEYAERFARETGERGTLSERNLKRLVAGRKPDGTSATRPRPATVRLLERIFETEIDRLLAPLHDTDEEAENELRQMLNLVRRIDDSVLAVLHDQLNALRRLDRQFGAVTHNEVVAKCRQIAQLFTHSLAPGTRAPLAALLSEISTLAGWQALDMGRPSEAWQHYEQAKSAGRESGLPAYEAHATAEQAFVLLDLDDNAAAVNLLEQARRQAEATASRALRAWLAAAHGEGLAANQQGSTALHTFDQAANLLPSEPPGDGPFVALDPTHLTRWRGHALARSGNPQATDVLTSALRELDPTFTRAETGLRIDLATALHAQDEPAAAAIHAERARSLAAAVGSVRQQRRLAQLARRV